MKHLFNRFNRNPHNSVTVSKFWVCTGRSLLLLILAIASFCPTKAAFATPTTALLSTPKVVVFLVNGNGDCCMYHAEALIDAIEGMASLGVEITFVGLEARNLPGDDYANYAVPWNSLYNRHEHGFDIGENISNGTDNFIQQANEYIRSQPLDTMFIFIGHSFGGDSILSLMQQYGDRRRQVLFVGVIDPVDGGGLRATVKLKTVPDFVTYFFNRWQTKLPWPVDFPLGGSIGCNAQQCNQKEHSVSRKVNGEANRVQCGELEIGCVGAEWRTEHKCNWWGCADVPYWYPGTKNKLVYHENIPYDNYIQKQMVDIIRTLLIRKLESLTVDYTGQLYLSNTAPDNGIGTEAKPFRTIGEAASSAEDGATLNIKAGVYTETFELDKQITLKSMGGIVTIDGTNAGVAAASLSSSDALTLTQNASPTPATQPTDPNIATAVYLPLITQQSALGAANLATVTVTNDITFVDTLSETVDLVASTDITLTEASNTGQGVYLPLIAQ